jgi:hypothetical protein
VVVATALRGVSSLHHAYRLRVLLIGVGSCSIAIALELHREVYSVIMALFLFLLAAPRVIRREVVEGFINLEVVLMMWVVRVVACRVLMAICTARKSTI